MAIDKEENVIDLMVRRLDKAAEDKKVWMRQLQVAGKDSRPLGNLFNVMKAVELAPDLAGVVALEEFSQRLFVVRAPPWDAGTSKRQWSDDDDVQLQRWLQTQEVPINSAKTVSEAVRAAAPRYDALRDYLEGLKKWDGQKRLDTWLLKYFGVKDAPFARAVGKKWMVSAVARALQPGCKADHVLALEGPQGALKSSAVKILGGEFAKEDLSPIGTKDAIVELQGSWIVELSELSAMSRAETETTKSFITRCVDKFRAPYGRHTIEHPRRTVFVATTNEDRWLKDTTGNRRFWPVRVERVDLDALTRDRDQLWAEAVRAFRAGVKWWITEEAIQVAAEREQADRIEFDPWIPGLKAILDASEPVTTRQLLHAIDPESDRWSGGDGKRVGGIMRQHGWESYIDKSGGTRDVVWKPKAQRATGPRSRDGSTKKGGRSRGK